MIIECEHCHASVDAKVLATRDFGPNDIFDPSRYYFLECPVCESIILAWCEIQQTAEDDYDYVNPTRLYPEPPAYLHSSIPQLVRHSLVEADKCVRAHAYSAVAVMCGRSIEAICKLKVNSTNFAQGLKKLKDSKIIDDRLYEWGEALRRERNIGAHPSDEKITKEDAIDIFDFAKAICEYIFVLTERYEDYKDRKMKKKKTKS